MPNVSQVDASQASVAGEDDRAGRVIAFFAKAAQNCSRIAVQDVEMLMKLAEDEAVSATKAKEYLISIKNKAQSVQIIERQSKAFGVLLNDLPGAEINEGDDSKAKDYVNDFLSVLNIDEPTEGQTRQLRKLDLLSEVVAAAASNQAANMDVMCSINRTLMDDPFRNTVCGHAYDRLAIQNYIETRRQARQPIKCPVEGCASEQELSWEILMPDPGLRRAVDRAYFNEAMSQNIAEEEAQ